ncbi:endonuclease DDE [Planomonospora sphaerica]|uniref:Endonuclease DDE n=1 Tax=Planomonospora sphaerica TaxID=161355 RepID=A0A171CWF3_9ACTN|nr:endonuclease DDE [Planomonospora sphaerica]
MVNDLVMLAETVAEWPAGFTAFVGRFAGRFPRVEARRQMRAYVRGLLGESERKSGWTLAEAAGQSGPERMQRLLNFYAWDSDGPRDDVRRSVGEILGDARSGVLVVDETGFFEEGRALGRSGPPARRSRRASGEKRTGFWR